MVFVFNTRYFVLRLGIILYFIRVLFFYTEYLDFVPTAHKNRVWLLWWFSKYNKSWIKADFGYIYDRRSYDITFNNNHKSNEGYQS